MRFYFFQLQNLGLAPVNRKDNSQNKMGEKKGNIFGDETPFKMKETDVILIFQMRLSFCGYLQLSCKFTAPHIYSFLPQLFQLTAGSPTLPSTAARHTPAPEQHSAQLQPAAPASWPAPAAGLSSLVSEWLLFLPKFLAFPFLYANQVSILCQH